MKNILIILVLLIVSNLYATDKNTLITWGIHGSGINGFSFSINPVFYTKTNIYENNDLFAKGSYLKYNFGIGGAKIAFGWVFFSSPDGPRTDVLSYYKIWPMPFFPPIGLSIDFQVVKIYNSAHNKFLNGFADKNDIYFGAEFGIYLIGTFKISAYSTFKNNNKFCISYGLGL